jgi:hypothetical protein
MESYDNDFDRKHDATATRLAAENARLTAILRDVRMHCTFERDKERLFAKVWPLVIAFDVPGYEGADATPPHRSAF